MSDGKSDEKNRGRKSGPVLIEFDDGPGGGRGGLVGGAGGGPNGGPDAAPNPAEAPPVPDEGSQASAGQGAAMQGAAAFATRRGSRLARLFWSALAALLGAVISIAAWDFATGLLAARPLLGWIVTGLIALVLALLLILALREAAAFGRLRRIDAFQRRADAALAAGDLAAARALGRDLAAFYAGRADTAWGREALARGTEDAFDADAALARAEQNLLAPLDARARAEVEAAARQVATVTVLVPLALADVVATLAANLRMIRRIAEIYGGRAGTFGAWRLTRAVLAHLVATGALAVGDDLLEPVLGGSLLGKVSRRFGEGLVNGALTARVGVSAMEVCRPLPFGPALRPSVRSVIQRALAGLVRRSGAREE